MGLCIVRYEMDRQISWGVVKGDQIFPVAGNYKTLASFLHDGIVEAKKALELPEERSFSLDAVRLLSPVTQPARIVCQGANYGTHRAESGLEAKRPAFNLIFGKADSSLCGHTDDIICPSHVELLDYELELGLVIGKDIAAPTIVTDENLGEYVAGLVIANDVSARDIQLPQGQWLKGKSYRTFCPTGPYLYLFDREEVSLIHDLELHLWVNDELRQAANTSQLLFKPAETLTELSEIMDLSAGDLVLTGTTGGVALKMSAEIGNVMRDSSVPLDQKVRTLAQHQDITKYLKHGDLIVCEIKSKDGAINLGRQANKVQKVQ